MYALIAFIVLDVIQCNTSKQDDDELLVVNHHAAMPFFSEKWQSQESARSCVDGDEINLQEEVDEFDDTSIAVTIHLREETKKSH